MKTMPPVIKYLMILTDDWTHWNTSSKKHQIPCNFGRSRAGFNFTPPDFHSILLLDDILHLNSIDDNLAQRLSTFWFRRIITAALHNVYRVRTCYLPNESTAMSLRASLYELSSNNPPTTARRNRLLDPPRQNSKLLDGSREPRSSKAMTDEQLRSLYSENTIIPEYKCWREEEILARRWESSQRPSYILEPSSLEILGDVCASAAIATLCVSRWVFIKQWRCQCTRYDIRGST